MMKKQKLREAGVYLESTGWKNEDAILGSTSAWPRKLSLLSVSEQALEVNELSHSSLPFLTE